MTEAEQEFVYKVRDAEHEFLVLFDAARAMPLDGRWVSIAKTHIEQGTMALLRAVEPPTT